MCTHTGFAPNPALPLCDGLYEALSFLVAIRSAFCEQSHTPQLSLSLAVSVRRHRSVNL